VETTNGVKVRRCSRQAPILFLLFVSFQDLGGVFGEIALCVNICDTDINDAISTAVPKTTDTYISSDFTSVLVQVAGNCGLVFLVQL
jgi:hypothetical protein